MFSAFREKERNWNKKTDCGTFMVSGFFSGVVSSAKEMEIKLNQGQTEENREKNQDFFFSGKAAGRRGVFGDEQHKSACAMLAISLLSVEEF